MTLTWRRNRQHFPSVSLFPLCCSGLAPVDINQIVAQSLTNPYIHRHGFLCPLWRDRAVCLVVIGPIHHGHTVRETHKERERERDRLMFSFISCLEETCSLNRQCASNSLSRAVNYHFMGILVNRWCCASNAVPLLK